MPSCPNCGRENPDDARFCNSCATELPPAPPAAETRKTVTIVFCDVTGSTSLGEQLDPESLRKVMTRYFEAMRAPLERHGGTVEKFIGDAVMAVFGIPQVHEDDALRAVRAAADMRESLIQLNEELERDRGVVLLTRIGVHTGEVMAGDASSGHGFLSGDAGNVAARLEQAADPGDALISAQTYSLVRDAVTVEPIPPLDLKGKAEPVPAFRLLDVHPEATGHVRRLDAEIVGRERELTLLRQAFDRSASERACHLFTVLGAAGVGKSRLTEEFLARLGDGAAVFQGRCLSYGDGATFFPVIEIVTAAAGLSESDDPDAEREKVRALVGADPDADQIANAVLQVIGAQNEGGLTLQENLWSVRRLFECLAAERPLVLVFDDLHWAEQTLLELLDHVADLSRDAPILLLCMARPELLDERPGWGGGKFNATSVLLEPLSEPETMELVRALLGHGELDDRLRGRILQAAEGNPLYVEELLSMLIENELLVREERWVTIGDVAEIPVPPSVQALLAARLDRLSEGERAILGRASVVGKIFYEDAVRALSTDAEGAELLGTLTSLVRKGLIQPDRSDLDRQRAYRFHHLLLRDAAYQTLTKGSRADLHERFAAWLAAEMGERADEAGELIGYHLAQAHDYLSQLGPVDAHGREVAKAAAQRLEAAGHRATDRFDQMAGLSLLTRAVALLEDTDPRRGWLLVEIGEIHLDWNQANEALVSLSEALEAGRRAGEGLAEGYAEIGLARLKELSDPEGATDELQRVASSWIPRFQATEHHAGLARAYRLLADAEWFHCRYEAAAAYLERVVEHAREAGERQLELSAMIFLCGASFFGPAPRAEFVRQIDRFDRLVGKSIGMRWLNVTWSANVAMLDDRLDEARRLLEEARDLARSVGDPVGLVAAEDAAMIATLAGRWSEAEAEALAGYEHLRAIGDAGHASTHLAYAARDAAKQGKFDDALTWAERSQELGSTDDMLNQALIRQARALVLAGTGRADEAEAIARDAVNIMFATDSVSYQVDALIDLAEVMRRSDRPAEAIDALRRAAPIAERKGDRARRRIVGEALAALGASP